MAASTPTAIRASPSAWVWTGSPACVTACRTFGRSSRTTCASWASSSAGRQLMRIPISWLREYVDFDLPVERLAERLTLLGMEVQSISTIGSEWASVVVGQRVPVALPGAILPGGRRIGVTSIQGTESQGMLCSGAELGLTTDADGIMILGYGNGAT